MNSINALYHLNCNKKQLPKYLEYIMAGHYSGTFKLEVIIKWSNWPQQKNGLYKQVYRRRPYDGHRTDILRVTVGDAIKFKARPEFSDHKLDGLQRQIRGKVLHQNRSNQRSIHKTRDVIGIFVSRGLERINSWWPIFLGKNMPCYLIKRHNITQF